MKSVAVLTIHVKHVSTLVYQPDTDYGY